MFYTIGIDNGVSGTIAILTRCGQLVLHKDMPIKKELSYTKTKQYISRIDTVKLYLILKKYMNKEKDRYAVCYLERPMVNPGRFKATASALRALEATLIVLERIHIPYRYIDSKEWQRALLPKKIDKAELKNAAINIANRIFPGTQVKDADGLLIAEYARRQYE